MLLCERKIRETWNCIIAAHCCSLSKQEAFSHSHCLKLNYSPLITCCTFGHCPSDREQELHLLRAALPSQGSCSCTSTLPAGPHTQFVSLAKSFLIPVLNLTHRFIFPKSLKELKKKNRKKLYICCTNMDVLGPTPSCALYNYSCWFWFIFFCSSAVVCSQPATTRKSISLVPSCKAFCCPSGGGRL